MASIWRAPAGAAGVALIAVFVAAPPLASAEQPTISANLTLGTDYVFRGVSQTLGGAAAQASVGVEFESGFYAYLWGSNVDFVPDGEVDDGADIEIDSALGYAADLGDSWSLDTMLVHYRFPGTVDAANYDYLEAVATLRFADRYAATVGFSDDVFGSGESGLHYALEADVAVPADYSMTLSVGYYDLEDAYAASYSHAGVSLRRHFDTVSIALTVHDTFGDVEALFPGEAVGIRAVLTVDIDW